MEDRLEAARACVAELTATPGWVRDRPPAVDWLDRGRWCRGSETDQVEAHTLPCDRSPTDVVLLRVERDRETRSIPQRAALTLALTTQESGWTVHFYGTSSLLEPGSPLGTASYSLATVSVARATGDGASEAWSATRLGFEVGDSAVVAPGEYLPPEELRARFGSPAALRDASLAQIDTLEEQVSGLLDRHQLSLCSEPDASSRYQCGPMGDGEGHAMYDTCVHRSLTDEETAAARARLQSEMAAHRELITREFRSIHRAVTGALVSASCWLLVDAE